MLTKKFLSLKKCEGPQEVVILQNILAANKKLFNYQHTDEIIRTIFDGIQASESP